MNVPSSHRTPAETTALIGRYAAIAAYLGVCVVIAYFVGMEEIRTLYMFLVAAFGLFVIVGLQQRAWVLILLSWALTGVTAILPVPMAGRDICVLLVGCAYLTHRIVSRRQVQDKWCILDTIMAINAAYIVFTFFHHPVGFLALHAETIGARPYFTIFLAIVAYWVLWRLPDSIKTYSRAPLFILAGATFATSLYALGYVVPSLPAKIPLLYAALDVGAYFGSAEARGQTPRYVQLGAYGLLMLRCLCCYVPVSKLLNPLRGWCYALLASMGMVMASGYRNLMAAAIGTLALTGWLRGARQLALLAAVGGVLLGAVLLGQGRWFDLPYPAQRALSFLPGKWSPMVEEEVYYSSEGRFDWWRQIIQEDVIKDWTFGDGFGATRENVELASESGQFSESVFVLGMFHNGPLTSIRYAGIVGLILLYTLMIAGVILSYNCLRKCRGTILQPLAFFLAIQLIWIPIHFTFLFGSYNVDMPEQIFILGLLRGLMRLADESLLAKPKQVPSAGTPSLIQSAGRTASAPA